MYIHSIPANYMFHRRFNETGAVAVDISNVAKWFYQNDLLHNPENISDIFPSMRLPWKRPWFEFKMPKKDPVGLSGFSGKTIIVQAQELKVDWDDIEEKYLTEFMVSIVLNGLPVTVIDVVYGLDEGGIPTNNFNVQGLHDMFEQYKEDEESTLILLSMFTFPVLMAISLLGCINVSYIDRMLPRSYLRRCKRSGSVPVKYKTLDIELFRKQVRQDVQPGESEIKRALHICRGNFAHYTEDKPLFGKYTGTYWRPMHVRGSKQFGEVIKDYRVLTERDERHTN